jgi:hypothetical protein
MRGGVVVLMAAVLSACSKEVAPGVSVAQAQRIEKAITEKLDHPDAVKIEWWPHFGGKLYCGLYQQRKGLEDQPTQHAFSVNVESGSDLKGNYFPRKPEILRLDETADITLGIGHWDTPGVSDDTALLSACEDQGYLDWSPVVDALNLFYKRDLEKINKEFPAR